MEEFFLMIDFSDPKKHKELKTSSKYSYLNEKNNHL